MFNAEKLWALAAVGNAQNATNFNVYIFRVNFFKGYKSFKKCKTLDTSYVILHLGLGGFIL